MTNSQLTVIMPAHDAETTIAAAVQSMLSQSYSQFELWILESGSSDRTVEVAKSFSDPRVKVFELGSMGFQDVLSYALENAKTEWLARMDADDLSFPNRLKEQMEVIAQRPDLALVGTRCVYLTPFGHIFETRPHITTSREIGPKNLRLPGDDARFFADASVIFRRSVALEAGGYDPEFRMGDVPLWFRILSQGKGWEIAKPLYLYRLHPNSISRSEIAPTDELLRVLMKYAPELLHVHYPEGSSQPKTDPWSTQRYWLRMAAYEALTGDRRAVQQAVEFLEHGGPFKKEAKWIRWYTYLGGLGSMFYRWYRRNKYRHRPDLEKSFTALTGQLVLERHVYAE